MSRKLFLATPGFTHFKKAPGGPLFGIRNKSQNLVDTDTN